MTWAIVKVESLRSGSAYQMTGSGIWNSGSPEDVLVPEGTWLQRMCCAAYRPCPRFTTEVGGSGSQPEVGCRVGGSDLMEKTRSQEANLVDIRTDAK